MAKKIIQWNCRGLRANFEELEILIKHYEPVAICLQELQVSDSYILDNNRHILLFKLPPMPTGHRPHGGAGILIRKDVPYSILPLNTALQAVACRVSTFRPITLCSLYLPPSSSWRHSDLLSLVSQLPPPVLLMGDFNAHNSLWGCVDTNAKGLELATFLLQSNLCLLNHLSCDVSN
jgi:exonuclease III